MGIKDIIKKISKPRKRASKKVEEVIEEKITRCANCNNLLPAGYCVVSDGRRFCSPACRGINH